MKGKKYPLLISCTLILVATNAVAQSGVEMFAATAMNPDGSPDVHIRWRLREGWFPAKGFHLYKITSNGRTLVKNVAIPADDAVDAILGPKFPTKRIFTVASGAQLNNPIIVPPIDFDTPRPPSSLPDFMKRKSA